MSDASVPSETMSNVDAAWLHMDGPTNRMTVVGVLMFDTPLDLDRLRSLVEARMLRFPRFRQKVVRGALGPSWEPDPDFDLDRHLRTVELPVPGGQAELQDYVSSQTAEPLDPDRPLWRFDFIPRYRAGSALVCRVHHCIGDGIALIYVMLAMADDTPDAPFEKDFPVADEAPEPDVLEALGKTLGRTLGKVAGTAAEVATRPGRMREAIDKVSAATMAAGKLALMPADPDTRFRGRLGIAKRAVWTRPLDLALVKRIGRRTGSTVNDVLLSAVSGALLRYLLEKGETVGRLNLRAVVPVNLRPLEQAYRLGNAFGLVFLPLPVGIRDPLDRIFSVRKRMNAIKNSPEAFLAFQILRAVGKTPRAVFDSVVRLFGTKATAVMTNVIGPKQPIYLAGTRLDEAMFWVPRSGGLGLGVSILSYDGKVWLGIATDVGLVPDPETILEGFYAEFDEMAGLVEQVED